MEGATDDMVIGLVSAPTVYVKLREWKVWHPIPFVVDCSFDESRRVL